MKRVHAVALLGLVAWQWPGLTAADAVFAAPGLAVTVTAPASGATVGGTVAVTAEVKSMGLLTAAGVQFQLDGVNLAAEDTAAPYAISWDTRTTNDGPHTLTAVARDQLGVRYTSDPVTVTVVNGASQTRIQETSAMVALTGQWTEGNTDRAWSAGTAAVSTSANARATVSFSGTGVKWIGFRGPQAGIAYVYLDGTRVATLDLFAQAEQIQALVFEVGGLAATAHTLAVEATGTRNASSSDACVVVDAFDITSGGADTTPPAVSITSPQTGATVSGSVAIRASASDDRAVAGVQFFVDGAAVGAEDTASPYETTWSTTTAAAGSHDLTARARDQAGNTTTSPAVTVTVANGSGRRIENNSSAIAYTGVWESANTDRAWSGATAAVTTSAGARATLTFSGTGVKWIGFRGPQAGIAYVYLDGTRVATVDLYAPLEQIQAVVFEAGGLVSGAHTLAVEVPTPRTKNPAAGDYYVVVDAFDVAETTAPGPVATAGDLFVSLETGPVQVWRPDGTQRATFISTVGGTGEGMALDAIGNLYVSRWCVDPCNTNGNTVEKYSPSGESLGSFGSGYDCAPHAVVFDTAGAAYVGQAGCTGAILKFAAGQPPVTFNVAPDSRGSFWIDMAPDGCTIFYTSWGPNVKRYDACARRQRTNFNAAALPGGIAQDLRVLPDGGVLVSSGEVVVRLNAAGVVVQTYRIPGENTLWAGLDLVGDGTFWVGNYFTSNVYRFDLASGTVITGFNTRTPANTVVGIRVKK